MISRYRVARGLRGYLAGATAARAGDEMSGPALLLLGFAVTGRAAAGSGLLACVTIAGAGAGLGRAAGGGGGPRATPGARGVAPHPPGPAPAGRPPAGGPPASRPPPGCPPAGRP